MAWRQCRSRGRYPCRDILRLNCCGRCWSSAATVSGIISGSAGRLGWTTHLHAIRSFEKLTAGGVTYLDVDLIRVLEEVLPRRFGGGPADYQLVEDESPDGQPVVRLVVSPNVGEIDERSVADAFLAALSGASASATVWARLWQQADLFPKYRK